MANEEYLAFLRQNAKRYDEIKHLSDRVKLGPNGYAHTDYSVLLDDQTSALSDRDLIILCDRGNACFGGSVTSRTGDLAHVTVYTD